MKIKGKRSRNHITTRENVGQIRLEPDEGYGSSLDLKVKTVLHTLSTGGTTSTLTSFFADGMCVMGLVARIATAVTTGGDRTTLQFGDGAIVWATKAALTSGTTFSQADGSTQAAPKIYAADTDLVLTVSGGSTGNITGGVVRIACYYYNVSVPTA